MRFEELVIFDLDDTLVDTSDVYWRARQMFLDLLVKEGFQEEEILDKFEAIDGVNIKSVGHLPQRYGKSMLETYSALQGASKQGGKRDVEKTIESCGSYISNHFPKLIDGALDLISWAASKYCLAVVTRGDPGFQVKKLKYSKIHNYFKHVSVVDQKDKNSFKNIIDKSGYNSDKTWIVGDSIKSDINPGIELGVKCILYAYEHKHYSWTQEYGDLAAGPFYFVRQLKEVRKILENRSAYRKVTSIQANT